jgi:hypothetical protein
MDHRRIQEQNKRGWGQEGTVTGETDGTPVQVAVKTHEYGNNQGRTNATSTNNRNKDDGMQREIVLFFAPTRNLFNTP